MQLYQVAVLSWQTFTSGNAVIWVKLFVGSNPQTSTSSSHIPQSGFELFGKALNSQAVLKKLREFSQTLAESDASQGLSLSQDQAGSGLDHLIARYSILSSLQTWAMAFPCTPHAMGCLWWWCYCRCSNMPQQPSLCMNLSSILL